MVELIISMSIFVVMVTVATGGFVQALRSQRGLNDVMAVTNNAGLVIEQMAREIRTGYNFQPLNERCSERIAFVGRNNQPIEYRLSDGVILRNNQPLTAPNVSIKKLCFLITKVKTYDPWRVTLAMEAGSGNPRVNTTVDIQTTMSPRLLPCDVGTCPSN